VDFGELARVRGELRGAVVNHVAAVRYFKNDDDSSFFKTVAHKRKGPPADGKLHGITTTFTCIESLLRAQQEAGAPEAKTILEQFVPRALGGAPDEWESEGAARIYCRVRALAPLLSQPLFAIEGEQRRTVGELLKFAWDRVSAEPGTQGIFEMDKADDRYPPNAYLTYFGLAALEHYPEAESERITKRPIALLWLEKTLASQVALHYQGSGQADSQQLAWAIAGLVRFEPHTLTDRIPAVGDLIAAGLRAFFAQQHGGSWPRGEPLFHYPEAGNAYCYPFETLGELLSLGADGTERADIFSRMLRPYAENIADSFRHAMDTARPLNGSGLEGWCSAHHPHRTSPESWATASVFSFLQAARRLFGQWTRGEAARGLGAQQVPSDDGETFRTMGDTWDVGYGTAGQQLATLFVRPLEFKSDLRRGDPDTPVLSREHARSAILFGPPGTGKTTLVRAIAGWLGWDFIEITPAMFLEKGVEHVSARADEVFRNVMELDRAVILFDEIDELIRNRDDKSDAIERFFTTTMLPRLAKLWDQRRVLFFVNTNAITAVDAAIRRSNRFDATIFVLPPSFLRKQRLLVERGVTIEATESDVTALLRGGAGPVPDLVWLGLITPDQVERLAGRLLRLHGANVNDGQLAGALKEFAEELLGSDWRGSGKKAEQHEVIAVVTQSIEQQRIDSRRLRVVATELADLLPDAEVEVVEHGRSHWRVDVQEDNLEKWARDNHATLDPSGYLRAP